jgi:uncharacterized protein YdcH (DUF465 family)
MDKKEGSSLSVISLEYISELKKDLDQFIELNDFSKYEELLEKSKKLDEAINQYERNKKESEEGVA